MKLLAILIACFAVTELKAENLQMQFNPWGGTGTDYQLIDDSKLTAYMPQLGDVVTIRIAGTANQNIDNFAAMIIDNRAVVDGWGEFALYSWGGNITAGASFNFEIPLTITSLDKNGTPLADPKIAFMGTNAALAGSDGTGTFITLTLTTYEVSVPNSGSGEDNYDSSTPNSATRGYINAPYTRYEAENGMLAGGAQMTSRSFNQADIQYEASDRICAKVPNGGSVEWTADGDFNRLGMVLRFSILTDRYDRYENKVIKNADVDVYVNGIKETTLNLSNYYSWKDVTVIPVYEGKTNSNWRMRFDEARHLVKKSYPEGATITLVSKSDDLYIDFIEVESVPNPIVFESLSNSVQYTGNGSDLQTFINVNKGKTVFISEGKYDIPGRIALNNNTSDKIQGAGMWYTQLNFTDTSLGGIAVYNNGSLADFNMTTVKNTRANSYWGLSGPFGNGTVERVWVEHFETGAWIGNYGLHSGTGVPATADGFTVRHCRFRNNYADGINLCQGSKNCVVEYCSFRNNGDDDMAIWPADDMNRGTCCNNTYRYNTAEHCWMASSCALYGGYGNKWEYIKVKDNYETGIRISGTFKGYGFDETKAKNVFSNIDVIGCGTTSCTYKNLQPAVDILADKPWDVTDANAAPFINIPNIDLNCMYIKNSQTQAIGLNHVRTELGGGLKNIALNGVSIDGTATGYPGVSVITSLLNNVSFCGTFAHIGNGVNIGGWASAALNVQTSDCISCESVAVTSVSVTPTSKTMDEGETFTIIATVLPTTATNKDVTWSSSDATVAAVDATGLVTAQKAGDAKITVKTADGNKMAECMVTITSATDISEALTVGTLRIYPNPVFNGVLIVELPNGLENETVQIYDLDGKMLLTRTVHRPKTEIDVSHLVDRTYIVKIGNNTKKIVIAKK